MEKYNKGDIVKFEANSRKRAKEYEADVLKKWQDEKTFEKSVEQRPIDNSFVFYDGPPFITGVPHHGTLLSSIVKDAVPRYQTMLGKRVERRWGWDCHGLPAENFVEKKLGITDRREIGTKISLEDYIVTARESMVATAGLWENTIDRIGRWVEFSNAYKTMDKDFMESVWWAFKTLYEKGKIYEGEKVLMFDTKFATPVSKNEVTMDNDAYQTVTDPSVFVKFKLKDFTDPDGTKEETYMLAWTTTPWTLPGNTALAVNPNMTYAKVAVKNEAGEVERFIIAQDLIEKVLIDEKNNPISYGLEALVDGSELVGLEYYPLFDNNKDRKSYFSIFGSSKQQPLNNFRVWSADYVSADSGTGVVHIAPSYGEEDFELAKKENIGILHILDDDGIYYDDISRKLYDVMPWKDDTQDLEVWSSNKDIAKGLKKAGIVWKIDYIQHEYPFNPRSKQRIMYRAIPSWFFDIEGQKGLMLEQNENINWFPGHLKHGRFAKNIEAAPDWNLSRDRFWATAMPVWKTESGKIKVVGSYEELKELSGVELEDYHRPWVDDITFEIDGEKYTRIDKVLDCWFESGSMPFAQFHYPFENKEKFESNFPGDFIVEYVGQVRAWFYYVHTINTALFGENAFKNVITTGVVAGNDGRKMSKSLGNFTDPTELMDQYSADSLRFLLLSSPLLNGEDFALHDKDVSDIARKLSMIWNMYDFFTMYASVDGWEFEGDLKDPSNELQNPLDKWIVSRVHQLRNDVTENMDKYDLPRALEGVLPMVDDASNWFVRRSRRRFWKSENGADKLQAYKTLHYVLSYLALILAPFTPFLSEELWSKLIGGESVHLKDWPEAGVIDEEVLADMAEVRSQVNEALALRAKNSVKIRQPLASATVIKNGKTFDFTPILTEELNIKSVNYGGEETILDLNLTDDLKAEGTSREVIRHIQNSRKKAGLNVDDRIKLNLDFDDDFLAFSIDKFINEISKEVLAEDVKLNQHIEFSYSQSVKVDSQELKISLEKI
jgi:isoleucyl-tRNA synthetase